MVAATIESREICGRNVGSFGHQQNGVAKELGINAIRVADCIGHGTVTDLVEGIDEVAEFAELFGPDAASPRSSRSRHRRPSTCFSRTMITISRGMTQRRGRQQTMAPAWTYSHLGRAIRSAWNSSASATEVLSGTSQATPLASGVVALYLAAHPTATPTQAADALFSTATQGALHGNLQGSPNRLLYTGISRQRVSRWGRWRNPAARSVRRGKDIPCYYADYSE